MPPESRYPESREYLLVYMELINAARCRGKLTYQELAQVMGVPLTGGYMGNAVGQMLGEISQDECTHGRPMLSAIVTGKTGQTGAGFFQLARELGRLQDESQ